MISFTICDDDNGKVSDIVKGDGVGTESKTETHCFQVCADLNHGIRFVCGSDGDDDLFEIDFDG